MVFLYDEFEFIKEVSLKKSWVLYCNSIEDTRVYDKVWVIHLGIERLSDRLVERCNVIKQFNIKIAGIECMCKIGTLICTSEDGIFVEMEKGTGENVWFTTHGILEKIIKMVPRFYRRGLQNGEAYPGPEWRKAIEQMQCLKDLVRNDTAQSELKCAIMLAKEVEGTVDNEESDS